MKLFSWLYNKTETWSAHRHARYYLAGVSFAESSFFPIPPDVMLVSMGLALPKKSLYYALIATLFSVAGGLAGYLIGLYGMQFLMPLLGEHTLAHVANVKEWLKGGGLGIVILASFAPFPYKIFTITAGAMHLPLPIFAAGSIIGRGLRFFMVSGVLYFSGDSIRKHLVKYIDILGWATMAICILLYLIWKFKG